MRDVVFRSSESMVWKSAGASWRILPGSICCEGLSINIVGRPGGINSPMKSTVRARLLLLIASLLVGTAGCETCQRYSFTSKLWTNDEMRAFHEPTADAGLKLYHAPDQRDVLVLYTEANEKNDSTRQRAYFLFANADKVRAGCKPRFLNPHNAGLLEPIPMVQDTSSGFATSPPIYALAATNGHSFTLHMPGSDQGPYDLPVYAGKGSIAVRTILTPFALVGDAVIFGGMTALLFMPAWGPALSGQSL